MRLLTLGPQIPPLVGPDRLSARLACSNSLYCTCTRWRYPVRVDGQMLRGLRPSPASHPSAATGWWPGPV